MPSATPPPEEYYIKRSTPYVPNSPLPVLIYRSALPLEPTPSSACEVIEPNNWLKGGVFKHYAAHHFHSVTHECYAVFKGSSRLLLGRGPRDPEAEDDLIVDLRAGDVIVLPAGVAHCSLESSGDYEYVGLYPKVCACLLARLFRTAAPSPSLICACYREVRIGTTISAKRARSKRWRRRQTRRLFLSRIRILYSVSVGRW